MVEKPDNFKRLNILFITLDNLTNTVIRTFPATSNFGTNNSNLFLAMVSKSMSGYVTVGAPYVDPFTSSGEYLTSVFTKITVNASFVIIAQVELILVNLEQFFAYVIYFPNTIFIYAITNPADNQTTVLSISNKSLSINIMLIMMSNTSTIVIDGMSYLVGISTFPGLFPINSLTATLASTSGPYSLIVMSPISIMDLPTETLVSYLDLYAYISDFMFAVCGAITVMAVISFSYIAANLITFPLNKLSRGIKNFFKGTDSLTITVMLN